jgi:hypothetical protein
MRKKRKKIGLLFILIVYIFISPEKEGRIFKILPQWIIDKNDSVTADKKGDADIPFKMGNIFGYFNKEGKVTLRDKVFYGVTQTDDYFINYSSITDQLVIVDSKGEFVNSVPTTGYPYFHNDRLFLISTNRKKISEINLEGDVLWENENLSEVTSLDANGEYVIAGYVNGDVIIVNPDNNVEKMFKPDLSRINTVYSTGLSDNSEYAAVISGVEPQYMLLFRKNHDKYTRIFSYQFVSSLRHSRITDFTYDNKYLYFGSQNTFYCYDIEKRKLNKIPVNDRLIKVSYIKEHDIFCLISKDEGSDYGVLISSSDGRIFYDSSFSAEQIYMKNDADKLYIGIDDKIYSVKLGTE